MKNLSKIALLSAGLAFSFTAAVSHAATVEKQATPVVEAAAKAKATPVKTPSIPVYRVYNQRTGEHFYTLNSYEVSSLVSTVMSPWSYEGGAWMAPSSSSIPVYRVYNPNSTEHFYTENNTEANILASKGWHREGIAFYSAASGKADYRLFNPSPSAGAGSHFITSSSYERDQLVSKGWRYEGVAWYATNDPIKTSYKAPATPQYWKDSLGHLVFTQQDSRWGNLLYGGDPIWDGGCGLVSTTMAIDALKGESLTPANTLGWANAAGAIAWNDMGQSVLRIAQHFGLKAFGTSASVANIDNILRQGGMVSVSGAAFPNYAGGSPFTSVGHYVVIKKLLPNGQWMIFDSNNENGSQMNPNNNKAFNPGLILSGQHGMAVALFG